MEGEAVLAHAPAGGEQTLAVLKEARPDEQVCRVCAGGEFANWGVAGKRGESWVELRKG